MEYFIAVVTQTAINGGIEETFSLIDAIWNNISIILGFLVSALIFIQQVNKLFTKIVETLKLGAKEKDVASIVATLSETEKLLREIKDLEELSAFANIDNKFLDEGTKTAFARVLDDYNTAETLTKEQWVKLQDLLKKE
jgi:uncharacterized protein YktA (UPF0223 family)